jgi:hypothetical protein
MKLKSEETFRYYEFKYDSGIVDITTRNGIAYRANYHENNKEHGVSLDLNHVGIQCIIKALDEYRDSKQ